MGDLFQVDWNLCNGIGDVTLTYKRWQTKIDVMASCQLSKIVIFRGLGVDKGFQIWKPKTFQFFKNPTLFRTIWNKNCTLFFIEKKLWFSLDNKLKNSDLLTYGTERWVCRCRLLNIITSENTIWRKNYNILNCLIQCRLIDCGLLSYVFHTYHIFNAKSSWWEMISRRGNSYFCVVGVLFFFSFSISVTLNIFWSEREKN